MLVFIASPKFIWCTNFCCYLCSGELRSTLSKHKGPIFSLKWNKKGDYLLTGSCDKTAIVWDVKAEEWKQQFEFHAGVAFEWMLILITVCLVQQFPLFGFKLEYLYHRSNTWCWLAQQCFICNKFDRQYDICLQDWRKPPYQNFCWASGLFLNSTAHIAP